MEDYSGALAAEQQFFAALIDGDAPSLAEVLADDFVLIDVMRGAEITKAALLAVVASGELKFEVIAPLDSHVRLYEKTAVITGRTQMSGSFGGTPFTVDSRYTHVCVEQQDRWRLVGAQGTPIWKE